ncbi:MAG: Do family serine endopeptidase [Bacteroidetes bacterium]|nr:Do family serine endopeptidase [Bacteroidota bacterium]MBL0018459.1 Do family serine endopeptidase [Bacteroidota bacterium]MBP6640307.1 Do family serine endopeptidase [Bacteroidia bacterium]MBP6722269.1 Do family serine endopeptidase [Bacteroidia bacterium]
MFAVALLGGVVTLGGYKLLESTMDPSRGHAFQSSELSSQFASLPVGANGMNDFTAAAELSTPAVVHVKSNMMVQTRNMWNMDPFGGFFDDGWGFGRPQQHNAQSTGSGVITTPDGYIVTNNHVVNDAQSVEVVLEDGRTYTAQVVGTDPSTDLALLKIDETNLPILTFGNSDNLRVGEWVLAVGNPFNLTSTVTAGIVSAKARNINILKDKMAIESFIQTDAAVNPGNSGGALVNARGELVGINTAIASNTGSYSGYSFAVPVEIVKKVIDDLMNHGIVQRAFLGANLIELNGDVAKKVGVQQTHGVYIDGVMEGGSAQYAGLRKGDIITAIDGKELRNSAELTEYVGRHRPGDRVQLTIIREGDKTEVPVELRNSKGTTDIVERNDSEALEALGAELEELSANELNKLGLKGGVKITKLKEGKLQQYTSIRPGFIITTIDNQVVTSIEHLQKILNNKSGGVMMEGLYPGWPGRYYYAFGM